jgi:hypothetical protein
MRSKGENGIAVRPSQKHVVSYKLEVTKMTKVNDFGSVFKMKERSDTSTLAHFSSL